MFSQIDLIIFFGFLALNTLVGIFVGKENTTIAQYALGDRRFSTGAIAGTLIATWIGAGFFLFSVSKIYTSGLPFIFIMVANGLMLLLLSVFYIPRMKGFLGNVSVASAMGNLYGKHVRVLSAIAGICLAVGYVGLQIKVLSNLVSWMTESKSIYIVLLCSIIVTIYSAFGGIKAVVYTDLIQFFTFGVFVPVITFILWNSLDNSQTVYSVVFSEKFLDYNYLFSLSWVSIFIWFILPSMDPSIFQRILMTKDTRQASRAFAIASMVCVTIIIFSAWLAILARATGKDLDPDNIINYILQNYSYKGLIGLTAAGIAAMVMSTVDSYINTSAILFSEDICKTFGIKLKNELVIAKFFAILAGIIGVFVALFSNNLFDITLFIANFYVPIVTAPLTLAIFGFRSTPKSALIGIFGGISTVLIWRCFFQDTGVDSVIPGLFANFICLIASHCLLKQGIGWVGVKDNEPLLIIRQNRARLYRKILMAIKGFNLKNYLLCQAPKTEMSYVSFGLFSLVSTLTGMYFLSDTSNIVIFFYQSVLTMSVMFVTYAIWPTTIKKTNILPLSWGFASIYLVISGTYMLLTSSFGTIQLVTFMANLLVIAILLEWKFAIIAIITGIYIGTQVHIIECGSINDEMVTTQFKILYVLLIISATLIAFVKPKQYEITNLKKINQDLEKKCNKRIYDLIRAIHHREEFIDRLDVDCLDIFHQTGNHINELYDKLISKKLNSKELHNIIVQIKLIIERMKDGSDYLSYLVKSLRQIKLNIDSADLYKILEKATEEILVIIQSTESVLPIICDRDKIYQCFNTILYHIKNKINEEITVLIENDILEHNISFNNEYKEKIKAYKITFSTSSNIITTKEINDLLSPKLKNLEEILFAEIAAIVDAHYGKFIILVDEVSNKLDYIITIPVNVTEVRPKIVDLLDDSEINLNKLYKLLHCYEKDSLLKIALILYNEGMDIDKIATITNLSQDEIEAFKTL
ncbi:MAG: hypothetical protein ACIPMY_07120 [Rickettsia endosymbiont of Pentastiridius leporinus]